jgi:hypothetical protein
MLKFEKLAVSDFEFDDGIYMSVPETKPTHLAFMCKTASNTTESCDVRLYKYNKALDADYTENSEGYQCDGTPVFEESDRAAS